VEHLKGLGIVDESRVAVSGWSCGGFMTTWLAAHYDGWSAAVAGAAVTDWFDAYNLGDITDYFRREMGGSPWVGDNAENYHRWPPITYAHRIDTPTLILATIGDERVPVTQAYKLFRALRDNGTEVQFIAYPVGGHFPSDPVHRRDVVRRWTDWIAAKFEAGSNPRR
jgi:dipeptidyl aminopeptidase/acylaminoacyl peptidase